MYKPHTKLTFCVVIPSYQRPQYLKKCMTSLIHQIRKPERVLVVMRDTDIPSHKAFEEFVSANSRIGIIFEKELISEPGFLPPIQRGIEKATGDIIAFIDDDAEALPDWLECLKGHYTDLKVGGVGGRCINIKNGHEVYYSSVRTVGKFYWFGRIVGNMYCDVIPETPREVDFFMGGNMSYRKEVLGQIVLDVKLNRGVAANYEVDLGLQVKGKGFCLIYEPKAKVKHYSAAWEGLKPRVISAQTYYSYAWNSLYITLKHAKGWRRLIATLYSLWIGDNAAVGLAAIVWNLLRGKIPSWKDQIVPCFKAKVDALHSI